MNGHCRHGRKHHSEQGAWQQKIDSPPLSSKKPEKKAEDYQSSVARHLVQNDVCARAYNDHSFRVVRVCLSKSRLDVMEALYIRSLKPDLCAQKTSITTLQ